MEHSGTAGAPPARDTLPAVPQAPSNGSRPEAQPGKPEPEQQGGNPAGSQQAGRRWLDRETLDEDDAYAAAGIPRDTAPAAAARGEAG
jgi:hypothetical protein